MRKALPVHNSFPSILVSSSPEDIRRLSILFVSDSLKYFSLPPSSSACFAAENEMRWWSGRKSRSRDNTFRENECEEEESIVRNSQKEMEREKKKCDRSHKDLVNEVSNITKCVITYTHASWLLNSKVPVETYRSSLTPCDISKGDSSKNVNSAMWMNSRSTCEQIDWFLDV